MLRLCDWDKVDPAVQQLKIRNYGEQPVKIYEADVGYKLVPENYPPTYLGYDDGECCTAYYLNKDAVCDEIYFGHCAGEDRDENPDDWEPYVPHIKVYTRQDLVNDMVIFYGGNKFDHLRMLEEIVNAVTSTVGYFDYLSDIFGYMEEHDYYPFCARKKVKWLN